MCGIFGTAFVDFPRYSPETIKKINQLLTHRGPDDEGYYFGPNVYLSHKRLSIIDKIGGKQPMWNANKTIVTIYNGEIYNFIDLRDKLIKKGYQFKTSSDTEVLLYLYEDKGEEFVSLLRGMFALAIWDERTKKLILARDRMGIKPLYYKQVSSQIVFSSELKAIIALPDTSKDISVEGLSSFLTYDACISPSTILREVSKLSAGSMLIFQGGNINIHQYESIAKIQSSASNSITFDSAKDQLRYLLLDTVRRHLVSDVPVGVFLSGGLDSSLIAALVRQLTSSKLETFSIAFNEDSFDESHYSSLVAQYLGTEHHQVLMSSDRAVSLLAKVTDILDEPLGDPALLPTYLLAQDAKRKVTVALSGEGSDELFYGYPTYAAHRLFDLYQALPRILRKDFIEPLINKLPASEKNFSLDFIAKRFINGADKGLLERHVAWMSSIPANKANVFTDKIYSKMEDPSGLFFAKQAASSLLNCPQDKIFLASYLDIVLYLQDGILMRTDNASMASSLEVRVPFLDNQVIEFARQLPASFKHRKRESKYILKLLAEEFLPKEVVYRKKKGFGVPVSKWLKFELKEMLLDLLSEDSINRQGIFQAQYVTKLINEHLSGKQNHRKALWVLLIFQLWQRKYIKS